MSRTDWNRPAPGQYRLRPGFRRIAMTVAYDGRDFCGWQTQDGQRTVQETLEQCLKDLTGLTLNVVGSGRTDSKVHAMGQVCHFDLPCESAIPAEAFAKALIVPPDITIRSSWEADGSFHSRFSAMAREYRYFIRDRRDFTCMERGLATAVKNLPDVKLMNSYAACLKGTHDFSAFAAAGDLSESKCRDIYESEVFSCDSPYGGPVQVFRICGNAFLYRQVRSMVGTMLCLARDNAPAEQFTAILESKDRSRALDTARPDGLYLWRVSFDPDEYSWFEEAPDGN